MTKYNVIILGISVIVGIIIFTVGIFIAEPKMHKAFQMNITEYVIKIDKEGNMTTTKSVTTTVEEK